MSDRVSPDAVPEPPPIRHCWVTDSNGRLPGLLLERLQGEGEWRSRVVRPIREDDGWTVVEELPARFTHSANASAFAYPQVGQSHTAMSASA
jgi:hypothetical protein